MAEDLDHPGTILIVHEDTTFREVLTRKLHQRGYLVLEARDRAEAFEIVIRQSRRIHLLLTDDTDEAGVMAATLKPYRPDMNFIRISAKRELSLILMDVAKALDPPYESASA